MQLALRGKQLLIKRVAVLLMVLVVFCAPLIKPPMKVEAAVIPVVAGAAIVAAAMSALGIGVAAGFDTESLATAAQKVWDDLSDSVRQTIVLTQVAGHTVAHFTEQALRDIFSGLVNAFPQVASGGVVYTHEGDFDSPEQMTDFLTQLGIDNSALLFKDGYYLQVSKSYWYNYDSFTNFRVLGYQSLPIVSDSYTSSDPYNIAFSDGTVFPFVKILSSGLASFTAKTPVNNVRSVINYSANTREWFVNGSGNTVPFLNSSTIEIPSNTPFVSILCDKGTSSYTFLISAASGQSKLYFLFAETALAGDVGAIPTPGQDVFNPANEKFYADGASVMNKSVDDVINRLKDGVGETGQISDQPDVITVPGQIVGDSVTDQTKGADQSGTIGKDIATPDDIAANDATNADRDTTKPTTPGEDTDIPDLSIPQIITNKFPFSIPWDLYNSVRILVAPAAAPKWVLPLRFDKLGVNTSITIDMAQFDGLAALSRWGLSLLFIISLIILSSKLVKR